ncbi:MAG: fumarylacetoacetate hydrolase family protein [Methylobacteriaceae bacterium]|nr:fumarylacetoacetate hydrolase family protein [Methylobacteriaceae bacterium]
MHFLTFRKDGRVGLAASHDGHSYRGLFESDARYPGPLDQLIRKGAAERDAAATALLSGEPVGPASVEILQPLAAPGKIICVGLNYRDHAGESGMKVPDYPTLFARFASSLIPHGAPIVRPPESDRLDYEGELVAVIGKGGRRIAKTDALDHVAGYSIFNDGSIRDYQLRTPQWTMGKNFDGTGPFGPVFVTADALPPGARGLKIETRLNGKVMQSASTDDLIFDVATLVESISVGITLEAGDLIVTGTPSGVGGARKPPVFMKDGDVCEIEIERIGVLRNEIMDEARAARARAA